MPLILHTFGLRGAETFYFCVASRNDHGLMSVMFYGTLPNILVYGTGKLTVGDFPRVGIVICAVACVLYAVCATTYWRWLGLF